MNSAETRNNKSPADRPYGLKSILNSLLDSQFHRSMRHPASRREAGIAKAESDSYRSGESGNSLLSCAFQQNVEASPALLASSALLGLLGFLTEQMSNMRSIISLFSTPRIVL